MKNILTLAVLMALSFPVLGAPCGDECKLQRCLGAYGSCVKSGDGYISGTVKSDPKNWKRLDDEMNELDSKRTQKLQDSALEGIEDITFEWCDPYYGFNVFKCTLFISFKPLRPFRPFRHQVS